MARLLGPLYFWSYMIAIKLVFNDITLWSYAIVSTMPLFAIMFLFFTIIMANLSLPGTSRFIGEFLVLTGIFQTNSFVAVLATTGTILGAAYALWLCNRVIYGVGNVYYISSFSD